MCLYLYCFNSMTEIIILKVSILPPYLYLLWHAHVIHCRNWISHHYSCLNFRFSLRLVCSSISALNPLPQWLVSYGLRSIKALLNQYRTMWDRGLILKTAFDCSNKEGTLELRDWRNHPASPQNKIVYIAGAVKPITNNLNRKKNPAFTPSYLHSIFKSEKFGQMKTHQKPKR